MTSYKPENLLEFADAVALKHKAVHGNLDQYKGTVTLHGLARLASESGKPEALARIREELAPFLAGERDFKCNFPNYRCGGNATAWMLYKGLLPEAEDMVRFYAEQLMNEAPRNQNGVLTHLGFPGEDRTWIDVAFAVTPFLLFAGLALGEDRYVEEGFQQTIKMVDDFRNDETGLLHQCRGFVAPGVRSEDHWSRGNGWGIYALTELACHLPDGDPRKAESLSRYKDLLNTVLDYQDEGGMWHQELTWREGWNLSYVETSGTGLFLYALGMGIQAGIADDHWMEALRKGQRGLQAYISESLDIYHTCRGCLCPGKGTKLDYAATAPVVNDAHAFGPVVLCVGQAAQLGFSTLSDLT
ncbi:MAG: glycoside hydrolase family 88 protein [Kiritimatiellae bacterium]|jgi:unsaturated rhamnogalacturonyl hydrolase|nr:glycoside hydrolase family 88 protein [Kiritimatiellia bacterium]